MEYRILEGRNSKRWARLGIAYTYKRGDRVLLFIPAWRSSKVLAISLEELNEEQFPKTGASYRWGDKVETTEDEDISPADLLFIENEG